MAAAFVATQSILSATASLIQPPSRAADATGTSGDFAKHLEDAKGAPQGAASADLPAQEDEPKSIIKKGTKPTAPVRKNGGKYVKHPKDRPGPSTPNGAAHA